MSFYDTDTALTALHGHVLGRYRGYQPVGYTPRCLLPAAFRTRNTRTTMSETQPGVLVYKSRYELTLDAIHTSRATPAELSNAFDVHLTRVPSWWYL